MTFEPGLEEVSSTCCTGTQVPMIAWPVQPKALSPVLPSLVCICLLLPANACLLLQLLSANHSKRYRQNETSIFIHHFIYCSLNNRVQASGCSLSKGSLLTYRNHSITYRRSQPVGFSREISNNLRRCLELHTFIIWYFNRAISEQHTLVVFSVKESLLSVTQSQLLGSDVDWFIKTQHQPLLCQWFLSGTHLWNAYLFLLHFY